MENESIRAMMILEILGKPKDHVLESLNALVDRLGTEKGVKILNKDIHEPINVENSKKVFTTFAELEIQFDDLEDYVSIMFGYMPSNVQIISPENLSINNSYLNEVGNKIIQRLHNYDAITKKVLYEHQLIMEKVKQSSPELFARIVSRENRNKEEQENKSKIEEEKPKDDKKEPNHKKIKRFPKPSLSP